MRLFTAGFLGPRGKTTSLFASTEFSRILAGMRIRVGICAAAIALFTFCHSPAEGQQAEDIITLTREMVALQRAGRHAEALPLAVRALALAEASLEPDHPTIAIYVDHLGVLYHALGDTEKAQQFFQRALGSQERILGVEHLAVSTTLLHFAKLYMTMGEAPKAEPLLQRALIIRTKIRGAQDASVAAVLAALGLVHQALARYSEAEAHFKQALTIQMSVLGPANLTVASTMEQYAQLLRLTDRPDEAAQLTARAQAIRAASSASKN